MGLWCRTVKNRNLKVNLNKTQFLRRAVAAGVNRLGRESRHSRQSSAEVKNGRTANSTPTYAFIARTWTTFITRILNLSKTSGLNIKSSLYRSYNISSLSCLSTKKNTEALVEASKETTLKVNVQKTQYTVTSRDQLAGQNHNIKTDDKSFERVKIFRYLGTNITNKNSVHEEFKCKLKSGNACYHSVQNLFVFQFKNINSTQT
jgi:hypothetical protein